MRTADKISHHLRKISQKKDRSFFDGFLLFLRAIYHFFKRPYVKVRNRFSSAQNPAISRMYLRHRKPRIGEHTGRLTFVSFIEAIAWTNDWVQEFQHQYDLVIGLPRSGLLIANDIALKLGKPLTTPELFVKGHVWRSKKIAETEIRRILIVDDTITSGGTMRAALELISPALPEGAILDRAALITTTEAKELVDLHYAEIAHPRLFEWNLMHSKPGQCWFDLDGVLCANCPEGVDADEEKYLLWLENARPYLIPSYKIEGIVSCRLERYREITERWLDQNNVQYGELILWDLDSKDERQGRHAEYKSQILLQKKPELYIESSPWEAEAIHKTTSIPVLCTDDMELYN